jgi:hypothetical protein
MAGRRNAPPQPVQPADESSASYTSDSDSSDESDEETQQQTQQQQPTAVPIQRPKLLTNKIKAVGTRDEVYQGLAMHTTGGLRQADIICDERTGKYKSVKRVEASKRMIAEGRSLMSRKQPTESTGTVQPTASNPIPTLANLELKPTKAPRAKKATIAEPAAVVANLPERSPTPAPKAPKVRKSPLPAEMPAAPVAVPEVVTPVAPVKKTRPLKKQPVEVVA